VSVQARFAIAGLLILIVGERSFASPLDDLPVSPKTPKTTSECEDWADRYRAMANDLVEKNSACSRSHVRSNSYVSLAPSCGGVNITAYKDCQEIANAAWCAWSKFSEKYRTCTKEARAAERKPFDEALKENDRRRTEMADQLLKEKCAKDSVFPKSEACNQFKGSGSGFEDQFKPK
jgi:hypothetical protein